MEVWKDKNLSSFEVTYTSQLKVESEKAMEWQTFVFALQILS